MSQKSIVITKIEFKRIILHVEGTFSGFENSNPDIIITTEDAMHSFRPQHISFDGNKFALSLNVLSINDEKPMEAGQYYLGVFSGRKKICGAVLDEKLQGTLNDDPKNSSNVYIYKNANHYFIGNALLDLDTDELYFDVDIKVPKKSEFFLKANFKKWKHTREEHIHEIKGWMFTSTFYFFSKHVKRKGNKILFASGSRAELGGNEEFIYKKMVERGLDKEYKCVFDFKESINIRRGFIKKLVFTYRLATSDFILIDDYYPDIYEVDYPKDVTVVQVWHACGAFKAVGLERMDKPGAPSLNTRVHKCYDIMPVSSEHSAAHNAEAFGIDVNKFLPIGVPRTDIMFDKEYMKKKIAEIKSEYPMIAKAKKVYMYAPTFRGNNARDAFFPFEKLDLTAWGKMLEETDSILLIKMHPFVTEKVDIPVEYSNRIIDMADYREVNDLLFVVDALITDYSSIIYDFSLLKRPMYFFAFDLKMYVSSRDFYEPYEDIVPGKIYKNFYDLLDGIKNDDYDEKVMDAFLKKNFKYVDGKSTDRFIDEVILAKRKK